MGSRSRYRSVSWVTGFPGTQTRPRLHAGPGSPPGPLGDGDSGEMVSHVSGFIGAGVVYMSPLCGRVRARPSAPWGRAGAHPSDTAQMAVPERWGPGPEPLHPLTGLHSGPHLSGISVCAVSLGGAPARPRVVPSVQRPCHWAQQRELGHHVGGKRKMQPPQCLLTCGPLTHVDDVLLLCRVRRHIIFVLCSYFLLKL